MKIGIYDWIPGTIWEINGIKPNSIIEGDDAKAIEIAGIIFAGGKNVMLKRNKSINKGTRKNPIMTEESITIFVDSERFQQR